MRGILAHQYDVPVERIRWVENNREPLFRGLSYPRSARFEIERVAVEDEAVAHGFLPLIETGRVQGVFLAATGTEAAGLLRKLFPDPYREIRDYVSATGVFPLNTVVTIRSDVIDQNPGLPGRLMEACQRAEQIYLGEIENRSEDYHMGLSLAALREMGLFPISHGLQENQAAIRMMVQYCYEQGLIPKIYEPVEVFADVP
jgi:4,5-dihydroxyphthalate decarboxylase